MFTPQAPITFPTLPKQHLVSLRFTQFSASAELFVYLSGLIHGGWYKGLELYFDAE